MSAGGIEVGAAWIRTGETSGKDYVSPTRRVDLTDSRIAVVEKAWEFSLVPWKPALERQIGKPVGGIMREVGNSRGVNWTIGRDKGGPTLS